jgi:hypothetical protein
MIPLTPEELELLESCRDMLARKGVGTGVLVLNMIRGFCTVQPTAGDDQSSTGTTQQEEK